MRFTNHLHTEIGASGIRPEGWTADGNGMFSRQAFEGDPTRIDQRLLPRIEIPGVLGFLTRQMNLDAIPEPCGKIQSPQADWDTYAFTTNMPDLGEARIDCARPRMRPGSIWSCCCPPHPKGTPCTRQSFGR